VSSCGLELGFEKNAHETRSLNYFIRIYQDLIGTYSMTRCRRGAIEDWGVEVRTVSNF
jgi:hypothetical protein